MANRGGMACAMKTAGADYSVITRLRARSGGSTTGAPELEASAVLGGTTWYDGYPGCVPVSGRATMRRRVLTGKGCPGPHVPPLVHARRPPVSTPRGHSTRSRRLGSAQRGDAADAVWARIGHRHERTEPAWARVAPSRGTAQTWRWRPGEPVDHALGGSRGVYQRGKL